MAEWTDPRWLGQAHKWIRAELDRLGSAASGPIEQPHVYPWATVLRVPTDGGDVWFKANSDVLQYETPVVNLLAERRPDCVPPLLAFDLDRCWMLMADAGERLREIVEREQDLSRWLDILPLYAGLQIELMGEAAELVALGAPDLRLATLPARYEALLADIGDDLPAGEREHLLGEIDRVRVLAEELAAFEIPETIQHDDLHDGQIFVADGSYRLLDWGDSCVSHPFFSLSVTLEGNLGWGLEDVENSVDTTPFRDAYLAAFAREYGDRDLVAAMTIALRLGWVCRSINGRIGGSTVEHTSTRLRMFLEAG